MEEKRKRRPGGGRKPLSPEERASRGPNRGPAVSIRLTPRELAELRTVAPPDVGVSTWLRDLGLARVRQLQADAMATAFEFIQRLDLHDLDVQMEVSCDDGAPALQAIEAIREAVRLGSTRALPPCTVRLRIGGWTGILPGMPDLLLPDPPDL